MKQSKKAIVFGAGGFIGGHLVSFLTSKGYWVRAVSSKELKETTASEIYTGDCKQLQFVEQCFQGESFDEVYQCAAEMGGITHVSNGIHDADIMSNSALININVLKACVKYGNPRILFTSSACVYTKDDNGDCRCLEEDAYPANPELGYSWEKIFSEKLYESYAKQYGLQIRIARLHSIIGEESRWKDGREKAHSALSYKVVKVEPDGEIEVIGDGTQMRTFLHIDDCIEGIYTLMQSDVTEPINIGSDELRSINELLDMLREVSGKQFTVKYISGPIGYRIRHCPIEKAKKLIGWVPKITLKEATKRTYAWINSQISK